AIAVMVGLGTGLAFSLIGQRDTLINQAKASQKSAQVNLRSYQSLDGMVDSLQAAKALQDPLVQNPLLQLFGSTKRLQELQDKIEGTLQWAVYRVKETNRMTGDSSIIVRSIVSPISATNLRRDKTRKKSHRWGGVSSRLIVANFIQGLPVTFGCFLFFI
ncbi:MAG: hypothetical protein QNJ65_21980, partial [Xenococcaceae cyanobacterium MO_234.B1]|nr:hypothetical protein [Xenococcaceae cyanobacterium MO_234.B1]